MNIKYDNTINAAYVYLTEIACGEAVKTYCCDPIEVGGQINLDFDKGGRLVGIEVLDASNRLPLEVVQQCLFKNTPSPTLTGYGGENLSLWFDQEDITRIFRLTFSFGSTSVKTECGLFDADQMVYFSNSLRGMAAGECSSASYISSDRGCEISCSTLPSGSIEVATRLTQGLFAGNHLRIRFETSAHEVSYFASQILTLFERR